MIYNRIKHGYGYSKMSLSGLCDRKDKTFLTDYVTCYRKRL